MNSRVSWSVDGIDPSVRERVEAAARRSGMSLNDWLNATIGDFAPPDLRSPAPESRDVADVHQRLDSIARQIEQIARPLPRNDASREQGVARQLNDAISRLDARLSQISNPASSRPVQDKPRQAEAGIDQAASQVYRTSPPLNPGSLDFAVAEIAARQSELDDPSTRAMPPHGAAPVAPAEQITPAEQTLPAAQMMPAPSSMPPTRLANPGPDFSSLERHLLQITSQIEALQRPDDGIEQSIAAFRNELSEIRVAITEAMPRRAIESIENEIRSLSRRIDDSRESSVDGQAMANIEHALSDIREVLGTLTPAEQLAGYDEAIRNLGAKLDTILRTNDDPGTVQQLEGAIAALRNIVSNVASNDALARLSEDLHLLSSKVDQLTRNGNNTDSITALEQRIDSLMSALEVRERPVASDNSEQLEGALRALSDRIDQIQVGNEGGRAVIADLHLLSSKVDQLIRNGNNTDSIAALEQRIASLMSALEVRERPVANDNSEQLEGALRALSDRIDRMQVGNDGASAFAHLEQRVSYLLERLEASSDHRAGGDLSRVEDGLQDILRHLERQHAAFAELAETGRNAPPPQPPAPPQDAGLIDLVKRELSDIRFSQTEAGRHTQDSLEAVHSTLGHVVDRLAMIEGDLRTTAQPISPQPAPPPAAAPTFSHAPFSPEPIAPPEPETAVPAAAAVPQPKPELPNPAAAQAAFAAAPRDFHSSAPANVPAIPPMPPLAISEILEPHAAKAAARPVIAPELAPDHPLEPGTRPGGRVPSPSERIAASEDAISEIPAAPRQPVSSSSFIAAARRAAQAAAAAPPPEKAGRGAKGAAGDTGKDGKEPSTVASKIRAVLVAASVVVIVLGTFKMAMSLLDSGSGAPSVPSAEISAEPPQPAAKPPADGSDKTVSPDQLTPSMTSPTPLGRQSFNNMTPPPDPATAVDAPQGPVTSNDITGSIPAPQAGSSGRKLATVQVPPSEKLPDLIGGATLRTAALKGDAAAAYEVGMRFADGKGVAQNFDEAAKWLDRAAQAGVVPAIFRLGTFYEKGLSVKKDVDIARRYYLQAAGRGHAKAMHNLAVLDADGGGKGANYKSAAQWFRKAADRGVADSQFNLGILYARGIGVEANLAESYKWFSLAAAQGDADAATKRDDVAKRLDAQSLAAAKLAIQTFVTEPQPEDAIIVATPPGGWDGTPSQANASKPAAKQLGPKRTALATH
jgi:localization factor PodJL